MWAQISMEKYLITFQDAFSFATCTRTAQLSNTQYKSAIVTMKNKTIVVSRLENGIHWQWFIKTIKLIT
jgi:hypothetical protein